MSGPTKTKKSSVLISGCSSGIGHATAKLLGEKGWVVFAGVRREEDAERLRGYGTDIKPVFLDVAKQDSVEKAVEEVRVAVGADGLDAVINNAGIAKCAPFEYMPLEDMTVQFDVNIIGTIRLTKAALPLLRTGKTPGRIINVSSVGADFFAPYIAAYDATKAATQAFNDCLRFELRKSGIKVVQIKPGPNKTKFDAGAIASKNKFLETYKPGTEAHTLYGKDLEEIEKKAEPVRVFEVEPIVPAKMILKALTVKRPRDKYYDTWFAWFMVNSSKLMAPWFYDWLIRKSFMSS